MKHLTTFLLLAGLGCLTAVGADDAKSDAKPAETTPAPAPAVKKVRLKTTKGDIVIRLDDAKAPVSTANFLSYVGKKHYDGTVFHRVIGNFMIQGGGFALKDGKLLEKPTGQGIHNESQNGLKNVRGSVAMARTAAPDSATAQFFINVVDNASLDYPSFDGHGYAVFGTVVEGMDVVDKIKAVETSTQTIGMKHPQTGETLSMPARDVPNEAVVIESATVVN